jgi:uncharacterized protein
MEKIRLGRTNLEVSRWALGGIPLSTIMGGTTEETIHAVITAALDRGVTFIDTSRVYMDSEANISEAVKGRRQDCIIASKTYSRTADGARADLEESLKQLQTDKIEIHQLHAVYPQDVPAVLGKGGALEALLKARDEGMIGHIGATSHHVSVLIDLINTGMVDTVMFPFNVIEREPERELLDLALRHDIGTIVMKPLAGGAIRSVSRALRFFNGYPVDVILNGVSSVSELDENLYCMQDRTPLTSDELTFFEAEVAPLGTEFCRRCSYCMPCPNGLFIPDMIHVFYQMVRGCRFEDLPEEKRQMGKNLIPWLEACEECGACEAKCPYSLPTIRRKQELIRTFSQE